MEKESQRGNRLVNQGSPGKWSLQLCECLYTRQLVVLNATPAFLIHHRMVFVLYEAVHQTIGNDVIIIFKFIIISSVIIIVTIVFFRQNMLQFCRRHCT